jgi:hypothetical protein
MTSDGGTDALSFGSPSERVSVDDGGAMAELLQHSLCGTRRAEFVGGAGWLAGIVGRRKYRSLKSSASKKNVGTKSK